MICPKCGNKQWTLEIVVTNGIASCLKCGFNGPPEVFLDNKGNPIMTETNKSNLAPPIQEPPYHWTSHDLNVGEKDTEVLAQGGTQFETGAVRSADKADVRYDLISPIGMRRLAETMEEGRQKYGYFNWERGMPIGDILNHALAHIYAYLEGKPTGEDDLAHAAWNLFAAMHMEETHPELNHQLRFHLVDKYNPEPPALHNKNE